MEHNGSATKPLFPVITNISQVREAIKGCATFTEKQKDDYINFNYHFGHVGTFPDPHNAEDDQGFINAQIRRECRGITFSASTGEIIARPYHKFFNVNELDETDATSLDINAPHILLEKLDGAFVFPFKSQGVVRFGTKTGSDNKISNSVEKWLKTVPDREYYALANECLEHGQTPIFEWINHTGTLVVKYHASQLIVTAIRDMKTGEYTRYEEMVQYCNKFKGVPVVTARRGDAKSIQELIHNIGKEQDIEGYVLRFDDGRMYKIKSNWYTDHGKGNSDLFCQEWHVWKLVLDQKMDDVKAAEIKTGLKARMDKFMTLLYQNIESTAQRLKQWTEDNSEALKESKSKAFDIMSQLDAKERAVIGDILSGTDPIEAVLDVLKAHSHNNKSVDSVRHLVGNAKFYDTF
jgi:RNA ligase